MVYTINDITENTYNSIRDDYDNGIRDFHFEIDSFGGDFDAALKIYDLLRGDKENIVSARVDGSCMSAATILLLAAPLKSRTATKHSVFMCHSPLATINDDINLTSVEQLHNTILSAYNELKKIYNERTTSQTVIDGMMKKEVSFYADRAKDLGFISHIEALYNKTNSNKNNYIKMQKSYLKQLVNKIINGLKNEAVKTKDGQEFEVTELAIGAPADVADGVYELEGGTVITVEAGVIVDLVPAPEVIEEPVVENEGEEPAAEEPKVEEEAQEAADVVEEAATEVAEATSEDEIAQIVEEAVTEVKEEILNKYSKMVALVNACGGVKRLQSLKNAKSDKKNFVSNKSNGKRTLADLMALKPVSRK